MGILSGSSSISCPLCGTGLDHGAQLVGGRWQVKDGKLVPSEYNNPNSGKPPSNMPDYSERKPIGVDVNK